VVAKREVLMRAEREGIVVVFFKSNQDSESIFAKACKEAKIKPTRRQASKWLMKKGAAYKFGR
jgi:hypothetical protein